MFALASTKTDLQDYQNFRYDEQEAYLIYGMKPYKNTCDPCNLKDFGLSLTGDAEKGDSYLVTYNPDSSTISIEGAKLTKRITRHVKKADYVPAIFLREQNESIHV